MEPKTNVPVPPTPKKDGRKKPPQVKAPMPMKGFAMWLLMMALILTAMQMFQPGEQPARLNYSPDFVQLVKNGRVRSCEIVRDASGNDYITGEKTAAADGTGGLETFRVDVVVTEDLLNMLEENNVTFKVKFPSPFWQVFWNVVPFVLVFLLIYVFFFRQMKMAGGRAMSFGKSRAKLLTA
jgi:cell division protease FtsH